MDTYYNKASKLAFFTNMNWNFLEKNVKFIDEMFALKNPCGQKLLLLTFYDSIPICIQHELK